MTSFEELKNQWQEQSSPDIKYSIKEVQSKINKRQKKLFFTNIFISVSFAFVFLMVGWIWSSFPDRSPVFHISLGLMVALLLVTLAGMWAGMHYKHPDTNTNTRIFIHKARKKLLIQRFMLTRGLNMYFVLLLSVFYLYFYDILEGASTTVLVGAYGGLTLFFIIMYVTNRNKKKKNVASIQQVLDDLKDVEKQLD